MLQKLKAFYRSFLETRYNVCISDEFNFVWYRVAKVGTRSILKSFNTSLNLDVNGSFMKIDDAKYGSHYKFAFVRNPWDRLVSCYSDKVVGKKMFRSCWDKDFSHFVDYVSEFDLRYSDRHFRLQSALIPEHVDFIGKFENLSSDFEKIVEELKLPLDKMEHRNKSSRKDYKDYYDDNLRLKVAELYKEDIERFNYSFDNN
ncbi:sulfotransferase family 2 domain-containing protein [Ekhidna sp.]